MSWPEKMQGGLVALGVTAVGGLGAYLVRLIRKINTNEAQIALLLERQGVRDKQRLEDREDVLEIKADVKELTRHLLSAPRS